MTIFSAFHSFHLDVKNILPDWQICLEQQVLEHTALYARADRKNTNLNAKLSIRIGAYSEKGITLVELLKGQGKMLNLFTITKSNTLFTLLSNKVKQNVVIPIIAITAYVQYIRNYSFEEQQSEIQYTL